MADNVLDIILRAEVDQATADIVGFGKKVEQEVGSSTKEYKKLEAELDKVKKALQALEKTKSAPDVKPIRDLTGTIGVLIGRLPKLQAALLAATDPKQIERLNNILGATQARITALSTPTQGFAKGLGAIATKAPNATNALTNFGRVIQDAPFGIIGIANNIDPLIESFGRLSRSTGSTGGALKALGSALLGPAGIALAVSAVTSALIAFGPEIKAFFSSFGKGAKDAVDLTKSTEAAKAAIEGFGEAARQASAKETIGLDALRRGIENTNLSQKQRIFFVDELQKKYPAYFGSLTKEQILAGQVGNAYSNLAIDLGKAAKARAATEVTTKIAAKQLAVELKIANAQNKVFNENLKVRDRLATFGEGRDRTNLTVGDGSRTFISADEQRRRSAVELQKELDPLIATQNQLNKQQAFYNKFVDEGAAATANLGAKLEDTKVIKDELNESTNNSALAIYSEDVALKKLEASNALRVGTGSKLIEVIAAETNGLIALSKEVDRVTAAKQKASIAEKAASLIAVPTFAGNASLLGPSAAALEAQDAAAAAARASVSGLALAFDELNINMETVTSGIASSAIDGIFNAIASGENLFDSLIDSVKGFVLEIIKAIAKALILQAITKAFNAGTGGGGGFLTALLGGRANGGPVNAGVAYNVGEAGPEIFVPSTSGQIVSGIGMGGGGGGTLTTAISGNNLLFILNQASGNRQNNFG